MFGKAGFTDGVKVELVNGSSIAYGQNSVFTGHANLTDIETGQRYMQGLYSKPGPNERIMQSTQDIMSEGYGGFFRTFDVREQMTFFDQQTTAYFPQYPYGDEPGPAGHESAFGAVQRFNVPKISKYGTWIDVTSRSGFDLTCPRASWGDIKADVGDVIRFKPDDTDPNLEMDTWFMVVSISGANMVIRQMNNFNSTNATDYSTNGFYQVGAGTQQNTLWICTRIRQNSRLFVGDVTSGSAVITNVRHAFRNGSADDFTTGGNFDMAVGDYYLHHEIERANTAGSALKVANLVSAIDYTANTITLTETFNVTRANYPLPFFLRVYNA